MSDIFYFARRGVESIMDDEVTKRFSAEELQSWNLLTRSNYNFHYISLRLTVLWGLGVLIRYGFLLPLRCSLRRSNTSSTLLHVRVSERCMVAWLRLSTYFRSIYFPYSTLE